MAAKLALLASIVLLVLAAGCGHAARNGAVPSTPAAAATLSAGPGADAPAPYPPRPPGSLGPPATAGTPRTVIIGAVTGRSSQEPLVAAEPGSRPVSIEPAADVAVHGRISWDDIRPGDHIFCGGKIDSRGVVTVENIDVNVAQVWGTIAAVTSDGWLVASEDRHTDASIPRDSEGRVRVIFDPSTTPRGTSNAPIPVQTLLAAKPGTVVMLVGFRAPSADAVTAETLIGTIPSDAFGP